MSQRHDREARRAHREIFGSAPRQRANRTRFECRAADIARKRAAKKHRCANPPGPVPRQSIETAQAEGAAATMRRHAAEDLALDAKERRQAVAPPFSSGEMAISIDHGTSEGDTATVVVVGPPRPAPRRGRLTGRAMMATLLLLAATGPA